MKQRSNKGIRVFRSCVIALLLLLLLPEAGCKKHEIPSQSTYTITNTTGKDITFDMYSTLDDYGQNTNRISRDTFTPGATRSFTLAVGKTYWIDWYSADYSLNNWQSKATQSVPGTQLTAAIVDDAVNIKGYRDTTRSVMLNGNGTFSKWKGTLATGRESDGTYELTFRKDCRGEYTYTKNNGQSTVTSIEYGVSSVQYGIEGVLRLFIIDVSDDQHNPIMTINCELLPGMTNAGRDVLIIYPQPNPFGDMFPVVRQ